MFSFKVLHLDQPPRKNVNSASKNCMKIHWKFMKFMEYYQEHPGTSWKFHCLFSRWKFGRLTFWLWFLVGSCKHTPAVLPGDAALGRVILGQDGLCRMWPECYCGWMTVTSADKPTINHLLKGNCTYRLIYSLHNYYKDKGMYMCQLHHVYHIWRNCTRSFAQIVGARLPQMRVLPLR